jgi:medium-chain acyl-[acyl-carrier-protein] hydrolase
MTSGETFIRLSGDESASARLFCFGHAGTGVAAFAFWRDRFPSDLEVLVARLPGRERRLAEQPLDHMDAVVEVLQAEIEPYLDRPAAFFGHCLGAYVAFRLAAALRAAGASEPSHLFVSGQVAPHLADDSAPSDDSPYSDLLEQLRLLADGPDEVLEDPEMMELLEPVLRADFKVAASMEWTPGPRLPVPIVGFGSSRDPVVPLRALEAWEDVTETFELHLRDDPRHFPDAPTWDGIRRLIVERLVRGTESPRG